MKLTHDNYFTPENKYLTASKIKDFIKSRVLFKEKHIDYSRQKETTDAMLLGSMVDDLLTKGTDVFYAKYEPVARRNKKNPPGGKIEVTQTMWDTALTMFVRVGKHPAYMDLLKHKRQQIIQVDIPTLKTYPGIAGMLDFLYVKGKQSAIITDLKTAKSINPYKYDKVVVDLGYDLSMAHYGLLVHEWFGIPYKNIEYRHLVVEKDVDNIHNVGTCVLDRDMIDTKRETLKQLILTIDTCDDWTDPLVTWEEARTITPLSARPPIINTMGNGPLPE